MAFDKNYLAKFKGKKVTFREVSSFPDLKVQYVDSFPDYEAKVVSSNSFSTEIIKVQTVTSFPDVKIKKVSAFGDFELFVDGKPIEFKYSKTKEIMALLINNRGAQTTNGEIIAALWEDDGDPERRASYLSNLRQDLQNTMNRLRLTDIIRKQRGSLAIAADRIECDLYDWLEKGQDSRYHYLGDYMNQYSWPEVMHAELDEISWSFDE